MVVVINRENRPSSKMHQLAKLEDHRHLLRMTDVLYFDSLTEDCEILLNPAAAL